MVGSQNFAFATLTDRAAAQIADNILTAILIYGGVLLFGLTTESIGTLALLAFGIGTLIAIVHYFFAEAFWDGQTIGKKAVGIRVLRKDGSKCGVARSFLRNILAIIDILPTLWIVGLISISATEKNQRVGDLVAGTIVVDSSEHSPR